MDERAQATNLLLQACEERRVEPALLGRSLSSRASRMKTAAFPHPLSLGAAGMALARTIVLGQPALAFIVKLCLMHERHSTPPFLVTWCCRPE